MFEMRWYTSEELARELQVDTETILAAIHRGDLEAANVAKTANSKRPRWRISEASKVQWLLRCSSLSDKAKYKKKAIDYIRGDSATKNLPESA